jgi:DUF4097 and DUF4098 domain-containing protein YvlB
MLTTGVSMRKTRWLRYLLLTALAGSLLAADEWKKSFPVSGETDLRVEATEGSVIVRSWDRNEIEVRVTTEGWKIGSGEVRVTHHQAANRVEIDVRTPREHFSFGRRSVHIALQVPRELHAEIRTGDGKITAQDMKGELRLFSGDGGIEVDSVDGVLEARTGDGRIRASGRWDRLDLKTDDGSIEADARAGSKMSASWGLHTGDGHVTLRLPENFAADLDAHTGDGKITVDFPVTVSGSFGASDMRGRLNGGGQRLLVRTGDGTIRLQRI